MKLDNYTRKETYTDDNGNELFKIKETIKDGKQIYFEEFILEDNKKTITIKDYIGQRFSKTTEFYNNGKLVMDITVSYLDDNMNKIIGKTTNDYEYYSNGDVKSILKYCYEQDKLVKKEKIRCYDTTSGQRRGVLSVERYDGDDKLIYLLESKYFYTADGHKIFKEKVATDFVANKKNIKYKIYETVNGEDILKMERYLTYEGFKTDTEKLIGKREVKYSNGEIISDKTF